MDILGSMMGLLIGTPFAAILQAVILSLPIAFVLDIVGLHKNYNFVIRSSLIILAVIYFVAAFLQETTTNTIFCILLSVWSVVWAFIFAKFPAFGD